MIVSQLALVNSQAKVRAETLTTPDRASQRFLSRERVPALLLELLYVPCCDDETLRYNLIVSNNLRKHVRTVELEEELRPHPKPNGVVYG